ncbi:uncharacterized protein LOC110933570 [Helianthus annuus]|uniref:uncharacterized protein LOC110933570 n=1 Tax=Helianthus annuus TaxID=4232 RepID=UPI000B8FFD29|nr:uncharacterized protein LOC110933570 [Helianthus annuus]
MGYFNSALYVGDCLYGTSTPSIGMREFFECVQYNKLLDIQGHGLHFTWTQKPRNGVGILKKFDRVMGNVKVLDLFPNAHALYHPYQVSDHAPCILKLNGETRVKPKLFKFANFIAAKDKFKACVQHEWNKRVEGIPMVSVVTKLWNLKHLLRKLLHQQAYDEESFLKQKAKIEWLCAGDSNTSYFHNCVKSRNARSKIHSIKDASGNQFEGTGVEAALVERYANFLGKEDKVDDLIMENLFDNVISLEAAVHMVRQITQEEVKATMFSIGENKAPGPDGYMSTFFKKSWDIVGNEVTAAILQFFDNGKLLKQVNHTIIALVPKVPTPNSVLEYSPISC